VRWHPELAQRVYALKADDDWFIRSNHSSEQWQVFHGPDRDTAVAHGKIQPNMRGAMALLLAGVEQGCYALAGEPQLDGSRS
jgi:hypothetical protein